MNRMNVLKSTKVKSVLGDVMWYSAVVVVAGAAAQYSPASTNTECWLCVDAKPMKQGELMPRSTTANEDIKEITAKVQMHK